MPPPSLAHSLIHSRMRVVVTVEVRAPGPRNRIGWKISSHCFGIVMFLVRPWQLYASMDEFFTVHAKAITYIVSHQHLYYIVTGIP